MNIIDGGVTAPKGFRAYGLRAGIKEGKTNKDMAMLYSDVPAGIAGTFTLNKVKAAPVLWDQWLCEACPTVQAVVVNTGCANAGTGSEGYKNACEMADVTGKLLGIEKESVLVASTGVIGEQLNMEVIRKGIGMFAGKLSATREAGKFAAEAILTTDTHSKEAAVTLEVGGKTATIGAMCKGSGMIHPNMGTMLCFITTDIAISKELLVKSLRKNVQTTFNMVSVDGDTSTNDTVLLMANGMAENIMIDKEGVDYEIFDEALRIVMTNLAKMVAGDGEGATKLIESRVVNAADMETATLLAKSIITSNLTKAAVFGKDANWGRILCAMGYSGANFDPQRVDIYIESKNGKAMLCVNGIAANFDEDYATDILAAEEVQVIADLKAGTRQATAWGCDLTYDYVKINADYRS